MKMYCRDHSTGLCVQYLHEPEGILLHCVVVEHHIGGFLPDLISEDLEFLVCICINIAGDAVKPEVVGVPGEALVSERVHAVNQVKFFT